MDRILKSASLIFHPLWMPFLGGLFYFMARPHHYFPASIIEAKLLAIAILNIVIPILFMVLIRRLNWIKSFSCHTLKERRLPLLCYALVLSVTCFILDHGASELFYFFLGLALSITLSLLFTFIMVKASLHLVGISSLLGFIAGLSLLYHLNVLPLISSLVFVTGLLASSRLNSGIHNKASGIVLGVFIGLVPQVLFLAAEFVSYNI